MHYNSSTSLDFSLHFSYTTTRTHHFTSLGTSHTIQLKHITYFSRHFSHNATQAHHFTSLGTSHALQLNHITYFSWHFSYPGLCPVHAQNSVDCWYKYSLTLTLLHIYTQYSITQNTIQCSPLLIPLIHSLCHMIISLSHSPYLL